MREVFPCLGVIIDEMGCQKNKTKNCIFIFGFFLGQADLFLPYLTRTKEKEVVGGRCQGERGTCLTAKEKVGDDL